MDSLNLLSSVTFTSQIFQLRSGFENDRDIEVQFHSDRRVHSWYDHPSEVTYDDSARRSLDAETSFSSRLGSDSMDVYRGALGRFCVPQGVQPTILGKLTRVLQTAKRGRPIIVLVARVVVRLLGSFSDLDVIDHHTRAFTEVRFDFDLITRACGNIRETETIGGDDDYDDTVVDPDPGEFPLRRTDVEEPAALTFEFLCLKLVPATRSARESLRRVRYVSLDKATLELNPSCSICLEDFTVVDDDGVDNKLLIPLPCGHYHHEDCITRWLETSHYCPLCRYALPNVKDDAEPSSSS